MLPPFLSPVRYRSSARRTARFDVYLGTMCTGARYGGSCYRGSSHSRTFLLRRLPTVPSTLGRTQRIAQPCFLLLLPLRRSPARPAVALALALPAERVECLVARGSRRTQKSPRMAPGPIEALKEFRADCSNLAGASPASLVLSVRVTATALPPRCAGVFSRGRGRRGSHESSNIGVPS